MTTNPTQFDVILAGGGVMGCATAYYLLKTDPSIRVAVVEKDPSYRFNSTVLSDGNTRLQFNLPENIHISQYGLEVLKTFADDMAVGDRRPDPAFRQEGNLFICDEAGKANALAGLAVQQELGCPVTWLEADEIAARFPLYDPARFAGGTYGTLDGTMDPQAILAGYRDKAIELGAEFIHAVVVRVLHSGGRVTGVALADGTVLQAGFVVNSAGAWGADLARTAGVEIPVDPVMRQVFVLETEFTPETVYPLTVFPSGLYLIHEHGSRFMCGKSLDDDPVGYDFTFHRDRFEEHVWPELVEYAPAFDRLKIVSGWAGLYAVNRFDGNVVLGEWPGLKGFLLVNGFSGHGFQQCHAIGRHLSELILGAPCSLDLSVFCPDRILADRPVFEGRGKLV
ncbi:MAG TPA: FAD-binding oxidoreductase [Anaerolineales bacterium]|nr:FAD-binding oxidoreductase [Anaerolineales bacterium]